MEGLDLAGGDCDGRVGWWRRPVGRRRCDSDDGTLRRGRVPRLLDGGQRRRLGEGARCREHRGRLECQQDEGEQDDAPDAGGAQPSSGSGERAGGHGTSFEPGNGVLRRVLFPCHRDDGANTPVPQGVHATPTAGSWKNERSWRFPDPNGLDRARVDPAGVSPDGSCSGWPSPHMR